jgi:hypothetical protein
VTRFGLGDFSHLATNAPSRLHRHPFDLNWIFAADREGGPSGGPRWWHFDAVLRSAADAGIEVLPVVTGLPGSAYQWPRDDHDAYWLLVAFALAVERFPEVPFWPVLNEPNVSGNISPATYGRLLGYAADIAHARGTRVVSAGLTALPSTKYGLPGLTFLRSMLSAGALGSTRPDVFASHGYARTPKDMQDYLGLFREVLKQHDLSAAPFWVTEFGWSSHGTPHPFVVGEERQAAYLTEAAGYLRGDGFASHWPRVDRAYWFGYRDAAWLASWQGGMGLDRADGSVKPARAAFEAVLNG